jgi:3-oxoacyl-[acyl-carrier-protein] synthase II
MITPFGVGTTRTWNKLLTGESATVSLEGTQYEDLPCKVAGLVPRGKEAGLWNEDSLPHAPTSRTATFVQFALTAADEALADAGFGLESAKIVDTFNRDRIAVCVGSGIGSLDDILASGTLVGNGQSRKVSPFFVPKVLLNMAGAQISIRHGLAGPNQTVVTACAAGAHSIIDAARMIALGEADAAVAGGTEACISPLAIAGFSRARYLPSHPAPSPLESSFSANLIRCLLFDPAEKW